MRGGRYKIASYQVNGAALMSQENVWPWCSPAWPLIAMFQTVCFFFSIPIEFHSQGWETAVPQVGQSRVNQISPHFVLMMHLSNLGGPLSAT